MATRVFLSYSPKDEGLREELATHLEPLCANGTLSTWHPGKIAPGEDLHAATAREIDAADVVLLLVSADFLVEHGGAPDVRRAIERHDAKTGSVVPVLIRPCAWEEATFGRLKPLPSNETPVTLWPNRDAAWTEVARGLAEIARRGSAPRGVDPARRGRPDSAEAPSTSVPPTSLPRPEPERLLRDLEAAYAERGSLSASARGRPRIQKKIDELKQKLREGGKLQQGDSLGNGRYYLLRLLGHGGFGTVWEADDREAGKRVAIKVLHPHRAVDPVQRARFFRGARAMAELDHPGIVRVLVPQEEDAGFLYFVMELIAGRDLRHAILEKRIDRAGVVPLIAQVGEALSAAHRRGFVHRDVKPRNILIDEAGRARLIDFDLVSAAGSTGGTRSGEWMGTFPYAPPEQTGPDPMTDAPSRDAGVDVYGLGMTAIFCLHGAELPTGLFGTSEHFIASLDLGPLAPVLLKATASKPKDRYATVADLCEALRAASPPAPKEEPSPSPKEEPPSTQAARRPPHETPPLPPPALISSLPPEIPIRRLSDSTTAWSLLVAGGLACVVLAYVLAVRKATPTLTDAGAAHASGTSSASAAPPPPPSPCPPDMAFLSSGTFLMGAGASDPDAGDNERPAHPVTVDAFCLDVTEVTVASYRRCTKEPRSAVTCPPAPTTAESKGSAKGFDLKLWSLFCNADRADRNDHPINCVDWRTAAAYCAWAGGALPTEAQWEYAARGKEARTYPWGNEPVPGPTLLNACGSECRDLGKIHGQSWGVMYEDDDGAGATAKVASYPKGATPEGLVDLAGNVWEWVADANAGYRLPPTDSARIKPSWRVLRGGGWHHDSPHVARATFRLFNDEANRNSNVGFRCARPPTP